MGRLVLRGARLLDGEQPARAGTTVVVDGDRITAVHADGEPLATEPDDRVVDLAGRTLMPGMVSCHFHSTYHELGATRAPYGNEYPPAYQALLSLTHLQGALRAGYTGAIGAGGANDVEAGVTRAIRDGLVSGPRFLPCGRELSTTGHANDSSPWYWNVSSAGAVRLCDGADGFRVGVREEIKRGAEVIKLFVTGGHGVTAPRDRMEMTRDELAAAIEAAHARGVLVRGHVVSKRAIMLAIELGMDVIDHCDDLDDEVIAALVETDTTIVPSVHFPKTFLARFGSGFGFGADAIRADLERMYEVLPRADAAGVRIVLGDDYGAVGFPHGSYGGELHTYVEDAGIEPLTVLRWATRNGGELLHRGAPGAGTIRPGALADLLVVDGDPSTDIGVLADHPPAAVLLGGAVVGGALP